jgi:drug/metabolite transporter (DMT)-like permease
VTDSRGEERQYLRGVFVVLAATVLWSLSGIFVRLTDEATAWQMTAWRAGSTAVALFIFLCLRYRGDVWRRFRQLEPRALLASAGFFAVGSTLYVLSLNLTTVANVACLASTAPIFTVVLARIFAGERTGPLAWTATVLALVGVAVIFWNDMDSGNTPGNLLSLVVAFCFSGQTVALRRFRSMDMVPAICIGAAVVFLGVGVVAGNLAATGHDIFILVAMGIVQLAAPLVLFVRAARYVPAVQLSLIALLDVVFNPLWAWIGVGEAPGPSAFLGGGIIVGAVLISILLPRWLATRR